jgi:hypothetical protein
MVLYFDSNFSGSFVKINVIEIVLSRFLIFKIKETKDYVTSPRAWTCDFLPPFYVISLEETNRELNRILIYECRCDERLRAEGEDLHVSHTLGDRRGGLEHLKIETRIRDERFESVKGECVI